MIRIPQTMQLCLLWTLVTPGCSSDSSDEFEVGDTCEADYAPASVALKRLNRREYINTIRDLFHINEVSAEKLPEDGAVGGFDTLPDGLQVSQALVDALWDASAKHVATALRPRPEDGEATAVSVEGEDLGGTLGGCAAVPGFANLCYETSISHSFQVTGAGEHEINIFASGALAEGIAPIMVVSVDGGVIAESFDVTAPLSAPAAHLVTADLGLGQHEVRVSFTNDVFEPENRDLYVDRITVQSLGAGEDVDSRELLLVCTPSEEAPEICAKEILDNFVPRAWRRPASDLETAGLVAIVTDSIAAGDSFEAGLSLALRAALMAPDFMMRPEYNDVATDSLGRRFLGSYELATRLSYALWSSMPDDALTQAAAEGVLLDLEGLSAEVDRMLDDPRADQFLSSFGSQWLQITNLDAAERDQEQFPLFNSLKDDMKAETIAFFRSFLNEDKDIRELIGADYGYINEALAQHYGIEGVVGPEIRKVAFAGARIGGVLGQASVLTATSNPGGTSPVKRGHFVLDRLLCRPPPSPPSDIPPLPTEKEPGLSKREEMAQHRSDPFCAGCHEAMDPIGFGLDNFGPTGEWRELDDYGHPIDPSGELPGYGAFSSARELVSLLETSPEFGACFTDQLFRYMVGRLLTSEDTCQFEDFIADKADAKITLRDMVKAIVLSGSFRATTQGQE